MDNVIDFPVNEFDYLTVESNGETKIAGVRCVSGLVIATDDDGKIQTGINGAFLEVKKEELIAFMLTTNWWNELHELTREDDE